MNYYEPKSHKKGGSSALYILIACSLIAVGMLTWFLVSKSSDKGEIKETPSKNNNTEYESPLSSYNNSVPQIQNPVKEDVKKNKSDVPYEKNTSEQKTESAHHTDTPKSAPIMPIEGKIIKDFSSEVLQYSKTMGDMRIHEGIDIEAKEGTSVKSSADGEVTAIEESSAFGKTVTVKHKDISLKYCGLDNITVQTGQKLKMGDSIGTLGTVTCECSDKSHLHLEAFKDGKAFSPTEFIGKIPE